MNPDHYPPSPSYYRRGNADARDLVSPDYWTDSALVHLMRAGRKDGEPFADAVRNAFVCLALWFRSQSLPVPFYSAELDRLQSRIAELEAAALTAVSRPVAPTLDPLATLLEVRTDEQLEAWVAANLERCGDTISRAGTASNANTWAIGEGRYTASHAARTLHRILNAVKPDPFAELLEVSDDVALEAWLTDRYGEPVSDQLDCGVGSATIYRWHDADRNLVCATWFYGWQKWQLPRGGNVNAREAARTLHRMLTGGKP